MEQPKYKRVLLKISGEALAGDASRGLDFHVIGQVCERHQGVQRSWAFRSASSWAAATSGAG